MPGNRAPKSVRSQRHQFALEKLAGGTPYCEVVALVAQNWGCSRRTGQNVARKALDELAEMLDAVEERPMLAETINRLQRIAHKAELAGQYSAAVGATKALHEYAVAPHAKCLVKSRYI
jgi:hypothetical protein